MSTRVSSLANNQQLLNLLMRTQGRIQEQQVQITTEKVSEDYAGLAPTAERLINIENSTTLMGQFVANNELMDLDLSTIDLTLSNIYKTIEDFEGLLEDFRSDDMTDATEVQKIQDAAFSAMLNMQVDLNIDIGGKYVFAGGRTTTSPVDLGLTTLAAFQSKWTGDGTTFPVSQDNFIHTKLTATTGTPWENVIDTSAKDYGTLTFADNTPAADTITAATAGAFANLPIGSTFTVAGTVSNNGTFTIASNTGTVITLATTDALTAEAAVETGTVAMNTYPTSGYGTLSFAENAPAADTITAMKTLSGHGNLTFADVGAADTIVAATAGGFANIPVGTVLTITGTATNNGTFTVAINDGTTITVSAGDALAAEAAVAGNIAIPNIGALANIPIGAKITTTGALNAGNNGTFTVDANTGTTLTLVPTDDLVAEVGATAGNHGVLTFADNTPLDDTITTATAGAFNNIPVGGTFTVTGTASNDGTYTVKANDGTTITVVTTDALTAEAAVATGIVSAVNMTVDNSYYSGDLNSFTHKVAKGREFNLDVNALNPAFEKAIRAMGIIAQGAFGTNGGLDKHSARVNDALYLVSSSQNPAVSGAPPYGIELTTNIDQIQLDVGYKRVLIKNMNISHGKLSGFFDTRVANIENVDPLEVITRLLNDETSLEASYQAMARIRNLSLSSFLS